MLTHDDRRSSTPFSWIPPPPRSIDGIRKSDVVSRLQENLDMIEVGARHRPSQTVDILCAHPLVDTVIPGIYWAGGLTCDDGRTHSTLQRVLEFVGSGGGYKHVVANAVWQTKTREAGRVGWWTHVGGTYLAGHHS